MTALHLTNYDFFFGAIIITSMVMATLKGGVAQILSISTWILALFVTKKYNSQIEGLITGLISNELLRSLIAYLIAFIAIAIIMTIIKMIFHKAISSFGLGGMNMLVGAIFGIARGVIISGLIIICFEMIGIDKTHSWSESLLSPVLSPTVKILISNLDAVKNLEDTVAKSVHQAI
ncbi:MAG: CvpA family protein [Neisseriaceae bacterium]|nr:MAG: CvpA family protein [Neisseriaceae bacterium]